MSERVFMKGAEAIAESAVRAGCRFFAGYPITPQNEIPEYLSWRLPQVGGTFIQGESEVASINMVFGAAATGARALTSSSSPGISLKTEGISYIAAARLPAVIFSVQREGPGLGNISAAQCDYLQATKAPGHGGVKCIVYAPGTLQEACDLVGKAFDVSDRDRNPVIMLMDGSISSIMEPVVLPEMREYNPESKDWTLRKTDIHGIDIKPSLFNKEDVSVDVLHPLWEKMQEDWPLYDVMVEKYLCEDAEFVVTAYGVCARVARNAVRQLRSEGVKVGMIRPITVNPFPVEAFRKLSSSVRAVIDIEMCKPGQMIEDVEIAVQGRFPVESLGYYNSFVPKDEPMTADLRAVLQRYL